MEETPRQKKQVSYPVSCCAIGLMSKKSLCMISFNFACTTPQGLRFTTNISATSSDRRHSCSTPSPTIPVAPVNIIFNCIVLYLYSFVYFFKDLYFVIQYCMYQHELVSNTF